MFCHYICNSIVIRIFVLALFISKALPTVHGVMGMHTHAYKQTSCMSIAMHLIRCCPYMLTYSFRMQ